MRIGIDARFYGTLGKGLGRYTAQLIEHLEKVDTKNQYVIFSRPENYEAYTPKNKNFSKVRVDIPWYSLKEQLAYPFILKKHSLDLVHFPHFNVPFLYRRPFVLTLHDLILFHYPTLRSTTLSPLLYGVKYAAYRFVLGSALRRARHVLTVSEFTKQDILKHFPIPKERITVTYQANSALMKHGMEDKKNLLTTNYSLLTTNGIIHPYILYVGNAYPHKNLEKLVRAFSALRQKDLQLVLVGKTDHFYAELQRFVSRSNAENIVFTGEVTDEELDSLYSGARMYVFPSLYEGFGLPPLEAMAHGIPVACSRAASLPEVLGDAALYFDPKSEDSIRGALEKMLGDEKLREASVLRGHKRVKRFSWEYLAEKTLRVYRTVNS